MSNLFSVFDPSSNGPFSLNWVSAGLLLLYPMSFWLGKNFIFVSLDVCRRYLHAEVKLSVGTFYSQGVSHFLISLFLFIVANNFMGLFPYTFTASSHLSFTLSLALPIWGGLTLWSLLKSLNSVMSHLVPLGTPPALMPLMVIIESVSSLIRPITLSVRLAANMVAGHLLMVLISSPMSLAPLYLVLLIYIFLVALALLELGVSVIQAYVFSTLMSLYVGEVANPRVS